jgi:hypothetical protein
MQEPAVSETNESLTCAFCLHTTLDILSKIYHEHDAILPGREIAGTLEIHPYEHLI